jgi:hypothetical protein
MKSDKSLLFPFLNSIGRKLQPVLVSRFWLPFVILLVILLYLPSLFGGFFADDNWDRLEFSGKAVQKLKIDNAKIERGEYNLYAFSGLSAERGQAFRDKGIYPWWSGKSIKINFFRPLSSLTLALDYTLWPDFPLLMHIHSLLWFLLLVVLISLVYKRIFNKQAIAGLALLLFAIDDVHAGIAWICNRHAVVAMVFGALSLLLYLRGREKKIFLILSYVSFALSLLASEMGVSGLVFILAYVLILDEQPLKSRITALLPMLIIGLAWLIIRSYLGYGVVGSILYIDPVKTPGLFLLNLPVRFFLLLFSVAGLPIADMYLMLSPAGSAIAAGIAFACLCAVFVAIGFAFRKSKVAVFWAVGIIISILPLTSGFPRNTILGFPGLGMMGLAAFLFYYFSKAPKTEFTLLRRIGLKVLVPVLVFCYAVVGPLVIMMLPATFRTGIAMQTRLTDFENAAPVDDRYLVIINPPSVSAMEAGLMQRLFSSKAFPAYVRYLTSGESPVEIRRLDKNTIRVTPHRPFPLPPEGIRDEKSGRVFHFHLDMLGRWTDSFYYNPGFPLQTGEIIELSGVKITIGDVTKDGRIGWVVFHFDKEPEDPFYTWLQWDKQNRRYIIGRMPKIGETIVY